MPEPRPGLLLQLCKRASEMDFGLLIETDNVDGLRGAIYNTLKASDLTTEDFDIILAVPSTPNTIHLLRRSVELPE